MLEIVIKIILGILLSLVNMLIFYGPLIIYMMSIPRMLHMFQLESYQYRDYFRWLTKNPKKAFGPGARQLIGTVFYYIFVTILNTIIAKKIPESFDYSILLVEAVCFAVIFYTLNIIQIVKDKKAIKIAKKPLVYTARAKRLVFFNLALICLLHVSYITFPMNTVLDLMSLGTIYSVFIALIPFNIIIANFIAWPTETSISDHYINKARRKLNKKAYKNLIRIGITGSYGKTSTKYILKTILSEKYNVLATPGSYNTTMGNVKVINNDLKPEHEVFISEMGARYKRDIEKICDFVRPQIGIITSIGPQHLESFKNIDNIVKTKSEMFMYMGKDDVVVLPKDNEYCAKLYNLETKRRKYCYTLNDKKSDVYAKKIEITEEGCKFIAVTKLGEIKCNTKLLGEHNVENILGCITIAVHLGLTKEQIENGVSKIEPVEHRLQLIKNPNGTLVIDDAFNSNPAGAKMALDVLSSFKNRRKIIITPGMVELGVKEVFENKKFGEHMAKCTDIVILVGKKRSEPIVDGLKKAKFNEDNIFVVKDLNEATSKLAELAKSGDVILFENDLPDNYNE